MGRVARQVIGWALIALFGPAPFSALAAYSGETECRMACCKRSGRHSCAHHDDAASASITAHQDCRPDCLRGAAGLGSVTPAVLRAADLPSAALAVQHFLAFASTPGFVTSRHPFLFERPPPPLFR